MVKNARSSILARLRMAPESVGVVQPDWRPAVIAEPERQNRFTTMIEAAHGKVHPVESQVWPQRLLSILANRGIRRLLIAPAHPLGRALAEAWAGNPDAPELVPYDRCVEEMKDTLVHGIDAALTGTAGAIAETGSLVLRPGTDEPRLMSLLAPIHIAVLEANAIHDTLTSMMASQHWNRAMPTNLLLISGPSKTADIEQTLAYGVHGPKELIVLIME